MLASHCIRALLCIAFIEMQMLQIEGLLYFTDKSIGNPALYTQFCNTPCGSSHFACNTTDSLDPECGQNATLLNIIQYKNLILQMHNNERNFIASGRTYMPMAKSMGEVSWDYELANLARISVKKCALMEENSCRATAKYPHPGLSSNIFYWTGTDEYNEQEMIEDRLKQWFNMSIYLPSIVRYYPKRFPDAHVAFYTRVIIDRNNRIGCAAVHFQKRPGIQGFMFSCLYPVGMTNAMQIYRVGNSTSGCKFGPSPTYKYLCSIYENYSYEDFQEKPKPTTLISKPSTIENSAHITTEPAASMETTLMTVTTNNTITPTIDITDTTETTTSAANETPLKFTASSGGLLDTNATETAKAFATTAAITRASTTDISDETTFVVQATTTTSPTSTWRAYIKEEAPTTSEAAITTEAATITVFTNETAVVTATAATSGPFAESVPADASKNTLYLQVTNKPPSNFTATPSVRPLAHTTTTRDISVIETTMVTLTSTIIPDADITITGTPSKSIAEPINSTLWSVRPLPTAPSSPESYSEVAVQPTSMPASNITTAKKPVETLKETTMATLTSTITNDKNITINEALYEFTTQSDTRPLPTAFSTPESYDEVSVKSTSMTTSGTNNRAANKPIHPFDRRHYKDIFIKLHNDLMKKTSKTSEKAPTTQAANKSIHPFDRRHYNDVIISLRNDLIKKTSKTSEKTPGGTLKQTTMETLTSIISNDANMLITEDTNTTARPLPTALSTPVKSTSMTNFGTNNITANKPIHPPDEKQNENVIRSITNNFIKKTPKSSEKTPGKTLDKTLKETTMATMTSTITNHTKLTITEALSESTTQSDTRPLSTAFSAPKSYGGAADKATIMTTAVPNKRKIYLNPFDGSQYADTLEFIRENSHKTGRNRVKSVMPTTAKTMTPVTITTTVAAIETTKSTILSTAMPPFANVIENPVARAATPLTIPRKPITKTVFSKNSGGVSLKAGAKMTTAKSTKATTTTTSATTTTTTRPDVRTTTATSISPVTATLFIKNFNAQITGKEKANSSKAARTTKTTTTTQAVARTSTVTKITTVTNTTAATATNPTKPIATPTSAIKSTPPTVVTTKPMVISAVKSNPTKSKIKSNITDKTTTKFSTKSTAKLTTVPASSSQPTNNTINNNRISTIAKPLSTNIPHFTSTRNITLPSGRANPLFETDFKLKTTAMPTTNETASKTAENSTDTISIILEEYSIDDALNSTTNTLSGEKKMKRRKKIKKKQRNGVDDMKVPNVDKWIF